MARKTELKQKQSQKVIVNINTEKKKKRSKPRQRQEAKPAQQISQAIPYLGLQSANNAQLLTSLQNSLNALYAKNNRAAVPAAPAGSGFATVLAPPPAPTITPAAVSFPSLRPPPAQTPSVQTPETVPLPSLRPPPPPAVMPPPPPPREPKAAPVYPKSRPPQRIPAEEPAIARPSREPVAQVTGAVRGSYDLDTNKDGTVRKRGDKWKALPQEVRDLIIQEELAAKPVRARLIKDEEDTDAEVVQKKTRRKKQPENIEVDNSIPIEDTNVKEVPKEKSKQKFNEEANKVEKAILSQVLHTKTEIKPEPAPKTLLSLLPVKASKVAIAPAGDDTDYGDLVSESESF